MSLQYLAVYDVQHGPERHSLAGSGLITVLLGLLQKSLLLLVAMNLLLVAIPLSLVVIPLSLVVMPLSLVVIPLLPLAIHLLLVAMPLLLVTSSDALAIAESSPPRRAHHLFAVAKPNLPLPGQQTPQRTQLHCPAPCRMGCVEGGSRRVGFIGHPCAPGKPRNLSCHSTSHQALSGVRSDRWFVMVL